MLNVEHVSHPQTPRCRRPSPITCRHTDLGVVIGALEFRTRPCCRGHHCWPYLCRVQLSHEDIRSD